MLSRIVRQNRPLLAARTGFSTKAGTIPAGTTSSGRIRDISDADTTRHAYTHPVLTDDPNREMRGEAGVRKPPVFMRQKTGYHRADGSATVFRDSLPSVVVFFTVLFGVPISVGWNTNPGATWNGWYHQNQVLRRQTDVKKTFGKGGGGYGEGPSGASYDQRRAELGMIDKHRKKDLIEGQPTTYKHVNAEAAGLTDRANSTLPQQGLGSLHFSGRGEYKDKEAE